MAKTTHHRVLIIGGGWVREVKFDGYRVQVHKVGSRVVLFSRTARGAPDGGACLHPHHPLYDRREDRVSLSEPLLARLPQAAPPALPWRQA
jgi:hypothetical protein